MPLNVPRVESQQKSIHFISYSVFSRFFDPAQGNSRLSMGNLKLQKSRKRREMISSPADFPNEQTQDAPPLQHNFGLKTVSTRLITRFIKFKLVRSPLLP